MKVYISKYRYHWLSPYTILEKVFFWREIEYDEPIIERLSKVLTPFSQAALKFLDFVHPRITYVKIDRWDTWNMDATLSMIVLPMLKQLQASKHGAPFVDDEDVPEEIRSTSAPAKENEWDTDGNHFKRWDWVLNELIWTFEQLHPDSEWESKYYSGDSDLKSVPCKWDDNGKPTLYSLEEGPNHTFKVDHVGQAAHEERIKRGLVMFGKYYRGLWD